MTSPDTIEIPGIGQRALIIEDDGDRVLALIRSPGGAHSVGVRLDDNARRDLIRWLTTRTHLAQPYTDAELARGPNDTRDRTLTLALLADRVTALEHVVSRLNLTMHSHEDDERTTEEIARAFNESTARLNAEQPLPAEPACPLCQQQTVYANSVTGRLCRSCGHEWQQTESG